MSVYTKETYSEVCEFLDLLGNKYVSKLPSKLLQVFEENKSNNYISHINPDIPIKDQSLNEDTLAIIALLNLKYWCKNEQEVKRLKDVYSRNEELYQKKLKEKYNSDNIFKNKQKVYETNSTMEMIEYKSLSFYKKILNVIKEKLKK